MSPIYGGECVNSAEHVAGVDTEPPPPPGRRGVRGVRRHTVAAVSRRLYTLRYTAPQSWGQA